MDAIGHEKDACITRHIVKGLKNVGNTCFFNSVMQNLLALDGLREHFMKPTQFHEGPIAAALRELYVETSSEGWKRDGIDDGFTWWNTVLFSAICAKVPQFRGSGQQDSHELLRCLIHNLHIEELLNLSNSKPTSCGDGEAVGGDKDIHNIPNSNHKNIATLVDRFFQGQLCSIVCCSKCGYHSEMHEPFYDLSVSIPSNPEPMKVSSPQQREPQFSKTQLENGEDTTTNGGEELQVTQLSAELNTDDALDKQSDVSVSSTMGLDTSDDILNLSDDDGESKGPLHGGNVGDNFFKDIAVTTETREGEREAAVIPMSVDVCLEEFIKPERLSGWKCPNCTSNTKTDEYQLHSGILAGSGAGLNDNACHQTEVLCSLKDINNGQPSNQEGHQMRRGFTGHDGVPVHDSSKQRVSCTDAEGHSTKIVFRIFGAEVSSEIDGINQAERPASTGSGEEGDRISANMGEWDLNSQIFWSNGFAEWDLNSQSFWSSGEGHRLKKRKPMPREHEANSDGIIMEETKRYFISKAPPILTIHLKRFQHSLFGSLSKLSGHVLFEERLDLRPYLDPRCQDKDNYIYRLIGVVEHRGTMESGHYVSYVRCDQDGSGFQWFYVSDSHVKDVSLREVLKSEAYILFYEQCKL